MPCFRGIDVFIGAGAELERLPEFPHPDSASVSLVPQNQPVPSPGPHSSPTPFLTERSPTSSVRTNPQISVYIPSIPGKRTAISISCFPSVPKKTAPRCSVLCPILYNKGPNVFPISLLQALYQRQQRYKLGQRSGQEYHYHGFQSAL